MEYTKDMVLVVSEIDRQTAKAFVEQYHYSKVMPRITKICVGGYWEGDLVAVSTLGWGTRPMHTIRKIFPSLGTGHYLEIGKLCVAEEMPLNTESAFISRMIRFLMSIKEDKFPSLKLLFTWADGILQKPGYVYQASNFWYGGKLKTEMYLNGSGVRVHPRTFQGISIGEKSALGLGSRKFEVAQSMGYTKYFGYQFRYIYPLCGKAEWNRLLETSPYNWVRGNYPKGKDCEWEVQVAKGRRERCGKPPFTGTFYVKEYLNAT